MPKTFGGLLQQYRKEHDISLRSLAKQLNISPTFLSDIENDRRLPPTSDKNFGMIDSIIDYLDLTSEQAEKLRLAADKSLNEKGMISRDFGDYMNGAPKAQLAMRKAIDKKIDDSKWEQIIKIFEEE